MKTFVLPVISGFQPFPEVTIDLARNDFLTTAVAGFILRGKGDPDQKANALQLLQTRACQHGEIESKSTGSRQFLFSYRILSIAAGLFRLLSKRFRLHKILAP